MKKVLRIGKLRIRLEISWVKKYTHTLEYKEKKVFKDTMMYGTGIMHVSWIEPKKWYQVWRSK